MKAKILLAVTSYLMFQAAYGLQNDPTNLKIKENLEFYSASFVPQKVYLHLDKSEYITGETIWFKAYLMDGISHIPYADTTNIYVELINSNGHTAAMRILLASEGYAKGEIILGEEFSDGNYVLRAYTDWMRNFGEDLYFTQYLYINNPDFENIIPRREVRRNRRFNRQLERLSQDYQVAFFPEGGNLVAGRNNRIAFKVADMLGNGHHAEGEVIDVNGDVVASLETEFAGIGIFELEPGADSPYHARISINGSRPAYWELPVVSSDGYALRIDRDDDLLKVNVIAPSNLQPYPVSKELILIGHTRGIPHFGRTIIADDGIAEVMIEKDIFPSGITHFTVFTPDHNPVAERLVYIANSRDELVISPRIPDEGIGNRDYVDLIFNVKDYTGNPVEGTFSLSAVSGQGNGDHRNDMLSYILLGSDLKGITNDIQEYFREGPENEDVVDLLLLTHGWRRFDWDDVLAGNIPEIEFQPSVGLTVGGRVSDPAKNESLMNYPVHLFLPDHQERYSTRTGRNGSFAFHRLFYEGNVRLALSSQRLPANYPPTITLRVNEGRGYNYRPNLHTSRLRITDRGDEWSRQRRVRRPLSPSASTDRDKSPQLYGVPDQTIFIDYSTSTERNLYEVLRNRATGLSFEGGTIMIRGPSSFMLSNEPRFIVDGVFVGSQNFLNIYPRDVERIEIFRGASAAIFGVRGGTGVILAYTRRPGYHGFEDALEVVMLGYHSPSEFYSSNITVADYFSAKSSKTIHWDPDLISRNGIINARIPLAKGEEHMVLTLEGTGFNGGIGSAEFVIEIDE